jgi:hypothetical protein
LKYKVGWKGSIFLNLTLHTQLRCKLSAFFRLLHQNLACTCQMPRVFYSLWLGDTNSVWWGAQIVKVFIMQLVSTQVNNYISGGTSL